MSSSGWSPTGSCSSRTRTPKPHSRSAAAARTGRHGRPTPAAPTGQYLDDAQRAVAKLDRDGGGKPSGGKGPDRDSAASLIGDAKGGYRVDPDALDAYARRGHRVADELHALAKRELADVKHTASNGFGKAGAESGFAEALEAFAGALRHQSRALGNRADALATATHRVSKSYRRREDETARDLQEQRP